jgi:hypothetical protein
MSNNSTAAKDGGANQSKTTMPPVSQEYRDNWSSIFGLTPLEKRLKQEEIDRVDNSYPII